MFERCHSENTVLSHDLLEGSYIRAGLATDIALIDGYPEKYSSYIMRQHRWVRGDWQLIRWLKKPYSEHINSLSKWKILDNMRRSLLPISLLLTILLGVVFFPGNIFVYLSIPIFTLFLPLINMALEGIFSMGYGIKKIKLNGNLILGYKVYLYQGILSLMFLPHEAYMMLDAIGRTIYRVFISNKNLFECTTEFDMENRLDNNLSIYMKRMNQNIIISLLLLIVNYIFNPNRLWISIIISLLWLMGPLVAYIINKDIETIEIDGEDIKLLKEIGRKLGSIIKLLPMKRIIIFPLIIFKNILIME